MHAETIWILFFSWCIQSLPFAVCIVLYIHMFVEKKKAVYFAAFQKCQCFVLFIPSTQTEPVRASLKYAACRYRVSNTFCVPCMKTVSVNNCLDYAACSEFVNYYLYSTVRKMLSDSLLQPSLNLRRLNDPVSRLQCKRKCRLITFASVILCFLKIFIKIKMRYFFG
jgi:hypothetical protein